jgi:hypothetical protein
MGFLKGFVEYLLGEGAWDVIFPPKKVPKAKKARKKKKKKVKIKLVKGKRPNGK